MDPLRIFVSHTHSDNVFCDAVVRGLRDAGADVWYDEHNLGAGHLLNEIQRELVARRIFIVILSKAAFASTWVMQESQWAYNLYMREPDRVILPITAGPILAADFNAWLFLESFKRIEAPGFQPLTHSEAVAKVLQTLVLSPKGGRPDTFSPTILGRNEGGSPSVLWVDDRPSNNIYERRTLEGLGIQFTISTSTDDALGKLMRHRYDAIISDMGRPPDNQAGYTLLAEIRRLRIEIPFIIYASSDRPEHKAEAQERGAFGSTGTPFILFDLVKRSLGF